MCAEVIDSAALRGYYDNPRPKKHHLTCCDQPVSQIGRRELATILGPQVRCYQLARVRNGLGVGHSQQTSDRPGVLAASYRPFVARGKEPRGPHKTARDTCRRQVVGYSCRGVVGGRTVLAYTQPARLGEAVNLAVTNDIRGDIGRHPRRWADPGRDGVSHAPALVTAQELMFSTAVASLLRSTKITWRLINAIGVIGAALQSPPRNDTTRSAAVTPSRRGWHAK